jgi:phosphatidylserine/phosphatidylglycerophosphate/cardiolipin synthase-like enzyme
MMLPRRRWLAALAIAALLVLPHGRQGLKPLPDGLSFAGPLRPAGDVRFLYDLTSVDPDGTRHSDQQIFDEIFAIIGNARRFIVADMFLYNPYLGAAPEPLRDLSEEMTAKLIERKREVPDIEIILITDPVNTVYGGASSAQFRRLREAGIEVVVTRLDALRDSNPVYSFLWRIFVRPFGDGEGDLLPNPFGEGRVSLRSYLRLLNFKANHRKTIVADAGAGLAALVTSANPHDGSSAHTHVAIRFDGPAAKDLLETENAVLAFSGAEPFEPARPIAALTAANDLSVQVVTENKVKQAVLAAIEAAAPGDRLNLAMFYLSDRGVIGALKQASERGVVTRVLLDPNKDAFGHKKNGVPARPVARELREAGLPVRWCDTHGEQCHIKLLQVDYADGSSTLIAGSANYTRRNLEDLNLETDAAVRGRSGDRVFADARALYDLMWNNEPDREISTDYATYADESLFKRVLYRFMEASGISTF